MKTLKFVPELCALMLAGEKTTTWRLFDDKDIQVSDEISCVNSETKEPFGKASVTKVALRTLGTLQPEDWEGHEKFSSEEEMYETYRKYYGDGVGPETEVRILSLAFTSN